MRFLQRSGLVALGLFVASIAEGVQLGHTPSLITIYSTDAIVAITYLDEIQRVLAFLLLFAGVTGFVSYLLEAKTGTLMSLRLLAMTWYVLCTVLFLINPGAPGIVPAIVTGTAHAWVAVRVFLVSDRSEQETFRLDG